MSLLKPQHQHTPAPEGYAMRDIEDALEAKADADFAAHFGRVLLTRNVDGYNGHDNSVTVHCDPPARMRVRQTMTEDIHHWCDSWLDPYWDVEEVEPHPALAGIRSMWVYGPSYCTDGRTEPSSDWDVEPITIFQRFENLYRRLKRYCEITEMTD